MTTRQENYTTEFPLPINPQKPGFWLESRTGPTRRRMVSKNPQGQDVMSVWDLMSETRVKGEHAHVREWWKSDQCSYLVFLNETWSDGPYKVNGISYRTFERATIGKNGAMVRHFADLDEAVARLQKYWPGRLSP